MNSSYTIWYLIEIVILLLISIPTVIAFFTGAPWVPTPLTRCRRMVELAKLKPGDCIYDLGCGDGRLVHLAAKEYGADAVGFELSPLVYFWACVRNFFLHSKSKVLLRDFRIINLSNARALVFYLLPGILKVMRPKFESELKPGTLIISYAFEIEGWEPVYVEPKDTVHNLSRILVYEIPISIKAKESEAKK